jgi:hypothetical protein
MKLTLSVVIFLFILGLGFVGFHLRDNKASEPETDLATLSSPMTPDKIDDQTEQDKSGLPRGLRMRLERHGE